MCTEAAPRCATVCVNAVHERIPFIDVETRKEREGPVYRERERHSGDKEKEEEGQGEEVEEEEWEKRRRERGAIWIRHRRQVGEKGLMKKFSNGGEQSAAVGLF